MPKYAENLNDCGLLPFKNPFADNFKITTIILKAKKNIKQIKNFMRNK